MKCPSVKHLFIPLKPPSTSAPPPPSPNTNIHPAVTQSVGATHWSKEPERQDVTQPWPCTQGAKRVHNCCWGNAAGYLSGVTGDGKGNPPISLPYWITIVPCGYTPTARGALLSSHALVTSTGSGIVGGSWSTTSPTWEISALFFPPTTWSWGEERWRKCWRPFTKWQLSCWCCSPVSSIGSNYICICLPLSVPASKTDSLENEGW